MLLETVVGGGLCYTTSPGLNATVTARPPDHASLASTLGLGTIQHVACSVQTPQCLSFVGSVNVSVRSVQATVRHLTAILAMQIRLSEGALGYDCAASLEEDGYALESPQQGGRDNSCREYRRRSIWG